MLVDSALLVKMTHVPATISMMIMTQFSKAINYQRSIGTARPRPIL